MASVASFIFSVLCEIHRVIEKDKERQGKLYRGLGFIKREMEAVNALLKDSKEEYQGAVQETRIRQLQELAYDIEDFVEGLWVPGKYGRVLVAIGMDRRPRQLESIEQFKETISTLKEWRQSSAESSRDSRDDPEHGAGSSVDKDPEVIDGPKKKIVELLSPSPAELRVISIVGRRGVGKTALARAVYEDANVCSAFGCVAWFDASGCSDAEALLNKAPESEGGGATGPASLRSIPASQQRYLVFIDDVQQPHMWKDTVDALSMMCRNGPENVRSSRIIMITSVHSVSSACSSGSYVYRMQCLGNDESKKLFWRKVFGCQTNPPCSLETGADIIFSKCDGLPLALNSVAKYLRTEGECLESRDCNEVGQNLGRNYLSSNSAVRVFGKLRRMLEQCYESLPEYDHRSCLLYLSVFPMGHQIKSKSLVRRLMAEGLIAAAEDGCHCLNKFADQCIVDPVQVSSDSRDAKSCKVHGIVLEYIIQKSVSKNVVTLVQEEDVRIVSSTVTRVRRLSVQSSTQETCEEVAIRIGLSNVRSLTIFNSAFNFRSCKMLRLLDLEGCTGIDNSFLDGICELLLLKYLSLRKTGVNKLPKQIKKLQRLETLDIRETHEIELPIEAIRLPKLAYLFGKFMLPKMSKLEDSFRKFLSKKSKLLTLDGFIVNKKQGPEQAILLAGNLKKVKVWGNDTSSGSVPIHELAPRGDAASDRPPWGRRLCPWTRHSQDPNLTCEQAEEGGSNSFEFTRLLRKRSTKLESVSIISSGLCRDFLGSLQGPCTISSIKLRGKLDSLPDSKKLNELGNIKKLQLFSTGLSSGDLSALQSLRGLEYLKLAEDGDTFCSGMFIVNKSGFESLKRLCIEAPKLPKLQFNEGAMGYLTSLHLLCPDSPQMEVTAKTVEGIPHVTRLNEIVLHSSASKEAMLAWEKVADGHPKRPCVMRGPEQKENKAA